MKLLNFSIIKLTISLIIGICIVHFIHIPLWVITLVCTALVVVLFIAYFISKKKKQRSVWFQIIAVATMITIGSLVYHLHDQTRFSNHYSHFILDENNTENHITFRVREQLKSTQYQDKYVVDILKFGDKQVSGKVLLNVDKDSTKHQLKVDDILITTSAFETVKKPLNPNQFDYNAYLKRQYIYHQIYVKHRLLVHKSNEPHTIFGYADALRNTINERLQHYEFKPDELAIINALLLGQRQDITKDTYTNYTNAGAVHILAVSGLHVGMVLLLLGWVLQPLMHFKHGNYIKFTLLLIMLWSFAIIAGLSASVTRAVTMFSIVTLAMHLKRPTNIYNTLAISVFFLLLCKPMFLFDVGFQMSYLAVLGIVAIRPIFYNLWKPKFKIFDYLWNITCVTIAAQFGVIPISLFYFHQFSGLFFISNLVIIPALGIVLGIGIAVIVLALFNVLPPFGARFFGNIISLMNDFVARIAQFEQFLLKDISFGILQVIFAYSIIISLINWHKKRNYSGFKYVLISVIAFQCVLIYTKHQTSTSEFVVFHKNRYSIIGERVDRKLTVTHNFTTEKELKNNAILKNYSVANYIDSIQNSELQNIYSVNNKTLLVIDSLGVYNVSFQPDYVLLRQSPKVNLIRIIDSIKPKLIIADGSNYKSYIQRWKVTCKKQNIPFHQTGEKGALLLK